LTKEQIAFSKSLIMQHFVIVLIVNIPVPVFFSADFLCTFLHDMLGSAAVVLALLLQYCVQFYLILLLLM